MNRWIHSRSEWLKVFVVLGSISYWPTAQAIPFAFATDTDSLYQLDLGTATASRIGPLNFLDTPFDIAISPTLSSTTGGELFGTDRSGNFYSIDPRTGAGTLITTFPMSRTVSGLDFSDAFLDFVWGVTFGSPFGGGTRLVIEVPSGIISVVQEGGIERPVLGLAVLDNNHFMNIVGGGAPNDPGANALGLRDARHVVRVIGAFSPQPPGLVVGLDFASDGNLYGVTSEGDVLRIDSHSALVRLVGSVPGVSFTGLAAETPRPRHLPFAFLPFTQVPEPSALMLIFVGLLSLLLSQMYRHRPA